MADFSFDVKCPVTGDRVTPSTGRRVAHGDIAAATADRRDTGLPGATSKVARRAARVDPARHAPVADDRQTVQALSPPPRRRDRASLHEDAATPHSTFDIRHSRACLRACRRDRPRGRSRTCGDLSRSSSRNRAFTGFRLVSLEYQPGGEPTPTVSDVIQLSAVQPPPDVGRRGCVATRLVPPARFVRLLVAGTGLRANDGCRRIARLRCAPAPRLVT